VRSAAASTYHVHAHDLGVVPAAETGFKLHSEPDTVRAADVSFGLAPATRLDIVRRRGYFPGAP